MSDKINYTLLVWQEVPEKTTTYLIPNSVLEIDNRLELIKSAHNKLINADEMNDGLHFLNAAIVPMEELNNDAYFDDGYTCVNGTKVKTHEPALREWRCIFDQYKQDSNALIEDVVITRVVVSGMWM